MQQSSSSCIEPPPIVPMPVIYLVTPGSKPHSEVAADLTKTKFNPNALYLVGSDSESPSTRYSTPEGMKGANDTEDGEKVVSLDSESHFYHAALHSQRHKRRQ